MQHKNWTTAIELEKWADKLPARSLLPQLLRRLINATLDAASVRLIQFPSAEGIQRAGIDGLSEATVGNAKIPAGRTAWEAGCDAKNKIKGKADRDFEKRPPDSEATFIFVTPRKWDKKAAWSARKRDEGSWGDVRCYDSADLEEWLEMAPAVDIWLAHEIGLKPLGVCDLATHWKNLAASIRIPLKPSYVLADRAVAKNRFQQWVQRPASALAVQAPSPTEVVDFVAAVAESLDEQEQSLLASRTVIVETRDAWRALSNSGGRLILIAGPNLELESELIAEAVRQENHVVAFASQHAQHGAKLKLERMYQSSVFDALRAEGMEHGECERVSREAGGSFTILKRVISQSPSLANPSWSTGTLASELVPMLLAGAWDDRNTADQEVLSALAGLPYPELLKLANRMRAEPDPPIVRLGSEWMMASRADSWRLLQWALTSDALRRFENVAFEVLSEEDPAFDLPPEEQYLAPIGGKTLKFSNALRKGLADTLGLMGVANEAIDVGDSCSPKTHAAVVVRRLLEGGDWLRWASLSPQLPDLAEAAPDHFLQAVEADLRQPQPDLLELFERESDGVFGRHPHTGLLWALEVLAWEPQFLGRASLTLARLAARDPGGRMSNRPGSSLHDIFLP